MARRTAAIARMIPAPPPAADPDTISASGSSSSVPQSPPAAASDTISDSGSSWSPPPSPPPQQQPGRNHSFLQVVRAGAPVVPTPDKGKKRVAVEETWSQVREGKKPVAVEEMWSRQVVQGKKPVAAVEEMWSRQVVQGKKPVAAVEEMWSRQVVQGKKPVAAVEEMWSRQVVQGKKTVAAVEEMWSQVVAGKKPVFVEEMWSRQVVEGKKPVAVEETWSQHAGMVAATTTINRYLRNHGQIPMTRPPKGRPDLDLNAPAPPDYGISQPPPQVDRPVICAYCNCAFCFAEHEVPSLHPVPGRVYPAPPVPITLNLLTPPAVGPLYRERDAGATGATPERLLVCSCEYHFKVTMGLVQQQPGGAPSLVWKQCISCLVQPIVVGSEGGASSSNFHANNPEPYWWSRVVRGDEDDDDPLNLTLGRR